jgi:hypothetical protein
VPSNLKILQDNRESLLLAEAAAWLHDWSKCTDEFLEKQACPPLPSPRPIPEHLVDRVDPSLTLTLPGQTVSLRELLRSQVKPKGAKHKNTGEPKAGGLWGELLRECHRLAHTEKQSAEESGKQPHDDTRLSSPFGYEGPPLKGLTTRVERLLCVGGPRNRSQLRRSVCEAFTEAPGDTRRPVNEVTLWEWSHAVAALYKAALAKDQLTGAEPQMNIRDLSWRLLSIRIDSAGFLGRAARISDLLGRRRELEKALDRVRGLLEEEYPLGTEVYRDENGSVFVVPDLACLLDLTKDEDGGERLAELILERFAAGQDGRRLDGEVVPSLYVDREPWTGSAAPREGRRQVPPIAQHLEDVPATHADPGKVSEWWVGRKPTDLCPVCGLRPQGAPGLASDERDKARERKLCHVCEQRRQDRSRVWLGDLATTVWMDEVADRHGRIALLVGQFGIDGWLKPDGMVGTLFVIPPGQGSSAPKNASFARLRRVWETTKRFWVEVREGLSEAEQVGARSPRLRIRGSFHADPGGDKLAKSQAYELLLGGSRLSIACEEDDESFLTTENLQRFARVLSPGGESPVDYSAAVWRVADRLRGQRDGLEVEEPTGYGSPNKLKGKLHISEVLPEPTPYTPVVPLFAEPRTFAALLPAEAALRAVSAIKRKYEAEMGKVRNRLPLTLGLVFADSRTPLAAILDAGRRLLAQPARKELWEVHADAFLCGNRCIVSFANGVTWRVPITMGDGKTEDVWYPYFLLEGVPADRSAGHERGDARWLVHVSKLKKGDRPLITPSHFDFEFLDAASRRFEISYENGRRRGRLGATRPYLLEELDDLAELWVAVRKHLSTAQIKNIEGLLEAKRAAWGPGELPEYESFAGDVLGNAEWRDGRPSAFEWLVRAALTGRLLDVVELYMDILKEKPEADTQEEKQ